MIVKQLLRDAVHFIFPPVCVISDKRLPQNNSNKYILDDILTSLDRITPSDFTDLNSKVNADEVFAIYTLYPDSPMEKIVHHIKYSGMRYLGKFMGSLVGQQIKTDMAYDYIVPVPLHKVRIRERHFNQSDYIADGIGERIGVPVLRDALTRIRYTKTQTHLTRAERIENVKGAFKISEDYKEKLNGKNIIVLDDIITTGSTINEVVKILKENGAGHVLGVCLAMARD